MSDALREQLQASLGTAYSLERELPGGGMSRVFEAKDLAFSRTVVVKLLSPDLAAGVNIERFEREIQVSAGLQHPHIVPLLNAGPHLSAAARSRDASTRQPMDPPPSGTKSSARDSTSVDAGRQ